MKSNIDQYITQTFKWLKHSEHLNLILILATVSLMLLCCVFAGALTNQPMQAVGTYKNIPIYTLPGLDGVYYIAQISGCYLVAENLADLTVLIDHK